MSSISAGIIFKKLLSEAAGIKELGVTKIFPVVSATEAKLPYIVYSVAGNAQEPTKSGQYGSDSTSVEVVCYAATYAAAVRLAEEARRTLDCVSFAPEDDEDLPTMRSSYLTNAADGWSGDAFAFTLTFNVKIS